MNRQFYQFWSDVFSGLAQGQKQLEEITTWMHQGFTGADNLTELFRRCYGLAPSGTDPSQALRIWQKAIADFQQAFNQFADQWGWVSQAEHQRVLDKNAALEEKITQQQDTIAVLRELLAREGLGHTELFQHMHASLGEQSKQFHALMESIKNAYQSESKDKSRD